MEVRCLSSEWIVPLVFLLLLALGFFPSPVQALDGTASVQLNQQEGLSLGAPYSNSTWLEDYSLSQRVKFSPRFFLGVDAFARRENTESTTSGLGINTKRVTLFPGVRGTYRVGNFSAGFTGNANRVDLFTEGNAEQRDERLEAGLWANYRLSRLNLEGRAKNTNSWREGLAGDRENQDRNLSAGGQLDISRLDQVQYRYTNNRTEVMTTGWITQNKEHSIAYKGNHRFLDGKGNFSLNTHSSRFEQTIGLADYPVEYARPIQGGYLLDDTPEILDPLEPSMTIVQALYDNDLDTPTVINIGDSAAPVRDFGGDYRNFVYDFGSSPDVVGARLYVDTYLNLPEFMVWTVYATDDPQGLEWGPALDAGDVSATYQEWENGRQGWEFTFDVPVTGRWIKFVNAKLGPTVPDLYVTELEVFKSPVSLDEQTVTYRHRIDSDLSYKIVKNLEITYGLHLDLQRSGSDEQDQDGIIHDLRGSYYLKEWRLAADQVVNYRDIGPERVTNSINRRVSLSSPTRHRFQGRLWAGRVNDRSRDPNQTTDNIALSLDWQIAPQLRLAQQTGYGLREYQGLAEDSRSWFSSSVLRGAPRPNLTLELRRTDRWVDAEAGSGFTTFNESNFNYTWAFFPGLNLNGLAKYQVRGERSDWLTRNTISWNPFQGGSMALRFFLSDFRSTGTDQIQFGGGAALTWRARPRLVMEGSIETYDAEQLGVRQDPTNIRLHARWGF